MPAEDTSLRLPSLGWTGPWQRTGWLGPWLRRHQAILIDALAVLVASLDVAMAVPSGAAIYSLVLSGIAVLALVFRRRFPFAATVVAMPGFLAGWSELGAMIALGTLAWKRRWNWRTVVAAAGVWACRFLIWSSPPASPLHDFALEGWREHVEDGIYACFVVAMPIAIGLLITTRHDLSARIVELAASRGRAQRLQAIAIRADERAKIAREMHDVVSHQVSLIAMQAGALQVTTTDDMARETAATIRGLSTRTLDELRELLGALRTATDGAEEPDLETLLDLVKDSTMDVTLQMDLAGRKPPGPVAGAAYRTVQEALTNVRKHAAYAPTTVLVTITGGALLVQVDNEPPVAADGTTMPSADALPSGGHGLLGLRERATLLGGDFHAGPSGDGGFRVRASLPLPPE
ncbi:MAG TPA: histidine kinase [Pseudonocardiaceae bacterium]|nr:histidine kinase [Pseudonocardiaceae bacterium]